MLDPTVWRRWLPGKSSSAARLRQRFLNRSWPVGPLTDLGWTVTLPLPSDLPLWQWHVRGLNFFLGQPARQAAPPRGWVAPLDRAPFSISYTWQGPRRPPDVDIPVEQGNQPMADDTKHENRRGDSDVPGDTPKGKAGAWYARFLNWRWMAVLLVASLVLHGAGLVTYRLLDRPKGPESSPEIALGAYRFLAPPRAPGRVETASFALHIALLENVEGPARARIRDCEHRVRQRVEELLRRAHGGDFEDPALAGLKRQLQEQINETLGMRAIADVMITNLDLTYREDSSAPADAQTAEATPWTEPSSG
jgi:hypothetical protein